MPEGESMTFFSPFNLLWLLPMAGLILLMYILKLRRKDVLVSSTYLWRQVIRDVQANAPFQKLRKNLLLFLQLAAVALLALALARPFWRGRGLGGRSIVLIVDTSASMTATDVGSSRLDAAKREAMKLVNDMKAEDQTMLLSAAAKPEAVTGFSADRSELSRAIEGLKPKETMTNMRDAVNLAAALVAARESSQIDVVSDGAFEPVTNVNLGKTHVVFHPIGRASHNVGITGVDYRRSLGGERMVQVFVTMHNFDSKARTFNVVLSTPPLTKGGEGGGLLDAHEVTLPPGGESPEIFDLPEPEEPITLKAQLDLKDDLAADNQAALVITPRKTIRALLVTEENVFLENAISVDPDVEPETVKPAEFTKPDGYDVVIFDGAAPKTLPEGNYFFVNCDSSQSPAEPGPETENQGLMDPGRTHPVLRYVDFGQIRWTAMRHGTPKGWAQELASSESGPAIVAGEKGRMRALWTGFNLDLAHGSFPLTVSYPIFVSNALRWLAHSDDSAQAQTRTGTAITLDAPPAVAKVTVVKPDGAKSELPVPPRGGAVFDDTDEIGVYTATGSGYRRVFAANLADYAESDIAPRRSPELGTNPPGQAGRQVTVVREIWPWLAAALLLLLAVEWWAFHRRVYVT
jgi:Ca-activated chloride channel family protein